MRIRRGNMRKSRFDSKTTGIINVMDVKKPGVKLLYWVMFAILFGVALVCLLPIVWIVVSSFKDMKEFLGTPPTIIPRSFHPEKVINVWKSLDFVKYYINTIILAAGEVAFCIFFNGLCGYVLSRLKPKGTTLILTLVLWTMMMSSSTNMIPLYKTFLNFPILNVNLTNSYLPMWFMAGASPFYVLMFKNFFDSIPISFIEASKIDGCSTLGTFLRIILPLSTPIVVVVAIMTVNAAWGSFLWPYILIKDSEMYTITVKLFSMKTNSPVDEYIIGLLFSIIPPIISYIIFQKRIVSGNVSSGVKG